LKRRLVVWHNILTAAKVNYSKDIFDLQSDLELWLSEEDTLADVPAQEELEAMVLTLMRMRNEKARTLGYDNFAHLMLDVTELGADWLEDFFAKVEKRTQEPYQELLTELKAGSDTTKITYADIGGLIRQVYGVLYSSAIEADSIESYMIQTVENIGFDFESLPVRFVENQLPAGVGGQGIAVSVPNDFRIALTLNMPLSVWLHELGHGLQWMHIDQSSPILEGYEWSFGSDNGSFAEGMAEAIGYFTYDPEWRKAFTTVTDEELAEQKAIVQKYYPAFLRIRLATIAFEMEFYKDLDQDPAELRKRLNEKYLLLEDGSGGQISSIANILYVSYPVYVQSYMIGEVIGWQVQDALAEKFGPEFPFNPEVGPYLVEKVYRHGVFLPWQESLKNVTGKELDLDQYFKRFGM
jgi:Zn-dependent M32 family carboxypeptidase